MMMIIIAAGLHERICEWGDSCKLWAYHRHDNNPGHAGSFKWEFVGFGSILQPWCFVSALMHHCVSDTKNDCSMYYVCDLWWMLKVHCVHRALERESHPGKELVVQGLWGQGLWNWFWDSIYLCQKSRRNSKVIPKVTPSFTPTSFLLPPPISSSFSDTRNITKFLLNLSMKCWNSAFNAHGSRVIIIVVEVWALRIYVAIVFALNNIALRQKERGDETPFTSKIGGKSSLGPSYFIL